MKNLAIIPARSGSKGVKDKNIRLLCGKPLLAYTIEAADKSGMFDEIYVSTDSTRYAEIAIQYGASVPFMRDGMNATDVSSSWDLVREAIKKYQEYGKTFDTVVLLQPTSPLRTAEDIIKGYNLFEQKAANAVVAVCETEFSPLHCNTLEESGSLMGFIPKEISELPRQKLKKYYRVCGALYIANVDYIMQSTDLYAEKCYAYIMERSHAVDIDEEMDFSVAEAVMSSFIL